MTQAGPAIPVITSTDAPDAAPALRIAVVNDGRPLEAGPARRVVVVSDGRPTQGNVPVPVVVASGVQASRSLAGPPIPVVVVSGSLNTNVQPNQIAGLTVWYKAETIALNDNDPVTTWADSGSGGIDVSQSNAANKPLYKTTGGPNSKPAVHFNSTVKLLTRAGVLGSALVANNQCHIFIVQNQTGTNAQNSSFGWLPSASNRFQAHLTFADTLFWDFGNSTAGQGRISIAQPGGWDDTWHMVQLIREPPNSGTSRIRVDASQLASGAVTQVVDGTASSTWNIGAGVSPFLGFIAELIIYNVALSTADRQLVETYLNTKYNLF